MVCIHSVPAFHKSTTFEMNNEINPAKNKNTDWILCIIRYLFCKLTNFFLFNFKIIRNIALEVTQTSIVNKIIILFSCCISTT